MVDVIVSDDGDETVDTTGREISCGYLSRDTFLPVFGYESVNFERA
jgi:hypothetical protein